MATSLIARYLQLKFEGYFMCRIATDPDPTNEKRGLSGYTMALASEDPLDQTIRLQEDDYVRRNLRAPARKVLKAPDVPIPDLPSTAERPVIGVFVTSVLFDGKPWAAGAGMLGARVSLRGRDQGFPGPIFESRNSIVGSDDTMAFVVNPFHIHVERRTNDDQAFSLAAMDILDPADPNRRLWQIDRPEVYQRRLSTFMSGSSPEVLSKTGIYDFYAYFLDRRRYLAEHIAELEAQLVPALTAGAREELELQIQEARSRIYQIEMWGDRVSSKLGAQVGWQFDINGPKEAGGPGLGGKAALDQVWPVSFWCGGWDGDLLTGYLEGTLNVPFEPA